ncbi:MULTISPECIES: SufE family protein [Petrimonas]|jgi:cysteine desulfuration protein SufE|uniref:Cysteine desulfuration protein SufE n=1 Tax=Petrimonas mucosa TaxID=1642646 RepID=A0A1G4G8Z5_9BACT|nr:MULTISPECIES: SufE family protein [Petrimonas]MDD3561327.1 SufE family protein [Petrimonas mucosa]SCM59026.1 Cysteine desulfuration protein SufE {ECO:0000255/HAMAP-Rule:MF_01832} [Petrimonas mucosa]SFU27040.1 cysteine desulfuration protein SufE [Porphyromonadaceae bacterium KHP3R9]HHT29418.1 SufE family protein [Petrimonas mucosa]
MTINETEQEIIDEFSIYDDWMDKYAYIIEQGNLLPPLDERYKVPENIIQGCQSRVWLQTDFKGGKLLFQAESDAVIVKGLLALVLRVFNNRTPDEILASDLRFMKEIGLTEHLSPTRSNGLLSVIKQIRFYAMAYKAKGEQARQ